MSTPGEPSAYALLTDGTLADSCFGVDLMSCLRSAAAWRGLGGAG